MGIAMGNSPDDVVAAIGWRRPSRPSAPNHQARMADVMLGPVATGLAALAPMVIVGVSRGLGAVLVVVATAVAGIAAVRPVPRTPWSVVVVGSLAAVTAAALLIEGVSFGVRIGAAVLGLMLAVPIAAVSTDSGRELRR